jgi:hypothetical protein
MGGLEFLRGEIGINAIVCESFESTTVYQHFSLLQVKEVFSE